MDVSTVIGIGFSGGLGVAVVALSIMSAYCATVRGMDEV